MRCQFLDLVVPEHDAVRTVSISFTSSAIASAYRDYKAFKDRLLLESEDPSYQCVPVRCSVTAFEIGHECCPFFIGCDICRKLSRQSFALGVDHIEAICGGSRGRWLSSACVEGCASVGGTCNSGETLKLDVLRHKALRLLARCWPAAVVVVTDDNNLSL